MLYKPNYLDSLICRYVLHCKTRYICLTANSIYGFAIRYDINPRLRSKHIECVSTYRFLKGNIENPEEAFWISQKIATPVCALVRNDIEGGIYIATNKKLPSEEGSFIVSN